MSIFIINKYPLLFTYGFKLFVIMEDARDKYINNKPPTLRRDLEFIPVQHAGQQLILIRDHLGLVQEGKAVPLPLYQIMALLDGRRTVRDLQMVLIQQGGGVIIGIDEVIKLLDRLDESFFLDSDKYRVEKDKVVNRFVLENLRASSHSGKAYPDNPEELKMFLEEILSEHSSHEATEGKVKGVVAPHIDIKMGRRVYSSAYGALRNRPAPYRIVVLGVGHQMMDGLFCLTEKDFETPFETVKNDQSAVGNLKDVGGGIITKNDFAHRAEHSIEFQLIFLQHIFKDSNFKIVPILCGSFLESLPEYSREAFLEKGDLFLKALRSIVAEKDTLIVAGVDFSHIGLKFGHKDQASGLESHASSHDRKLLESLAAGDTNAFWDESKSVNDQYNVCGFSALACLMETLPECRGNVLDYQIRHEPPTQSAVSFAAMVFYI